MKFKSEVIQSAYDKMEALFSKFAVEPVVEIAAKFTDAKLEDGVTIIQYEGDVPAQGQPINVVTPEGVLPMPDGEYKLEDGSILVCSGGLVAEYTPAEEKPEDEVANEPATVPATPNAASMEQSAPKRVIKSQVEEHVFSVDIEGIETIKVDLSSMFKPLIEENKALKELNKEMFSVINEIAAEPATQPTERVQSFNRNEELKNVKEAFKKLTAIKKK